jgi:hypothetical protein
VWTVIDPYGQGFRLQMIPAATNTTYQVMLRAQLKPQRFTSITSSTFINPIPDDFSHYFMQGVRTYCYQRSPLAPIRAKFASEYQLWLKALADAEGQGDREEESYGAYPDTDIMGGYDVGANSDFFPWGPR